MLRQLPEGKVKEEAGITPGYHIPYREKWNDYGSVTL